MKYHIWDDLTMHGKMTWARVVKLVDISVYSVEGLFKKFDETWGTRNVLWRRDAMRTTWNWKQLHK